MAGKFSDELQILRSAYSDTEDDGSFYSFQDYMLGCPENATFDLVHWGIKCGDYIQDFPGALITFMNEDKGLTYEVFTHDQVLHFFEMKSLDDDETGFFDRVKVESDQRIMEELVVGSPPDLCPPIDVVPADSDTLPLHDQKVQKNLETLLAVFGEIEAEVQNYKEILRNVAEKGDLKICQWNLKSGCATYKHSGAIVTISNGKGGEYVEVFTHDQVFAYYGVEQPKDRGIFPYSAKRIARSHDILKEAAHIESKGKEGKEKKESWFWYACMRFQAAVCRGVKGINSFLRKKLEGVLSFLLAKCGGQPGKVIEEEDVENPDKPDYIRALWRELPHAALAAIRENLHRTKLKIEEFFSSIAEWIGKNKYEIVGGLAVGGLAAAVACLIPLPVVGVIAAFFVGAAAAVGLVKLVRKAICNGRRKREF
mmetsp:Transcript_41578/g.107617  ORF Transcript_41578/g.107617 Transcript_41578/m.107617 type:complete len:425 (-) Transcript_41578:209-1483(-)|eukprot:CAMPEP_0113892938 /NCGR_PEP_ID=MMETSP0780_2-20120614/15749_1 /TAXON_ID=652834 /ORGANISM="Palpitomonas bilix" /LENGTH=424 /DNA_ID=CAMNT_0000883041 /DNA_START=59 /DNA_END=1333 /DNA_ORIENTATION=- /assembly_acc=CAM_ASM_000599